jgi:hypothetical protein
VWLMETDVVSRGVDVVNWLLPILTGWCSSSSKRFSRWYIYIISIANLHSTRHLGSADSSLKGGDIYTTIAAILSLLHVFDAAVLWYTHQDAVTLFLYKWGVSYFRLDVPSNGLETQKESKTSERAIRAEFFCLYNSSIYIQRETHSNAAAQEDLYRGPYISFSSRSIYPHTSHGGLRIGYIYVCGSWGTHHLTLFLWLSFDRNRSTRI